MGRRTGENALPLSQPDESFFRWFVPPSTPKKIVPRAQRKRTPFGKVCRCLEGLSLGELGGVAMDRRGLFEDGRDNFLEPFYT